MSELEGFEVMEYVPIISRMRKWNCGETIDAFLATGNSAMGKRFDDCRTTRNASRCFRAYAERHGSPVEVHRRGNTLILVRKDEA